MCSTIENSIGAARLVLIQASAEELSLSSRRQTATITSAAASISLFAKKM